jgi:hemerythrin
MPSPSKTFNRPKQLHMSFGIWKEKYSVSNVIIDDQHKRLLDILFRLERLVNHRKGASELVRLLEEMSEYAQDHFRSEEDYMQRIGYPGLDRHRELHSRYGLQVLQFTVQHMEEAQENPREVLNFLTHWWTDHILKVDMDYAKFVKNRG